MPEIRIRAVLLFSGLKDSSFHEDALRGRAFAKKLSGGLFFPYLFQCPVNYFRFHFARKNHDTVDIAEDDVA
jgi:hypothetical protein